MQHILLVHLLLLLILPLLLRLYSIQQFIACQSNSLMSACLFSILLPLFGLNFTSLWLICPSQDHKLLVGFTKTQGQEKPGKDQVYVRPSTSPLTENYMKSIFIVPSIVRPFLLAHVWSKCECKGQFVVKIENLLQQSLPLCFLCS